MMTAILFLLFLFSISKLIIILTSPELPCSVVSCRDAGDAQVEHSVGEEGQAYPDVAIGHHVTPLSYPLEGSL